MRVFDCFTFFNELDLLEIRLNELSNVVDFFVIAESPVTFQGKPKPLYFQENRARFAAFDPRIIHVVVEDMPAGEDPWVREFYQRNALKRGLAQAAPDDIIIIADIDEIPAPDAVLALKNRKDLTYLQMPLFVYYLNYQVLEGQDAPTVASYGIPYAKLRAMPDVSAPRNGTPDNYLNLQKMGALSDHLIERGGWHFSWLGQPERLLQKINAFSHTETRYRQSAEDVARMIAEKRFFVTQSDIAVRPDDELPLYVRQRRDEFIEKGLLADEASDGFLSPGMNKTIVRAAEASKRCPVCDRKHLDPSAVKWGVPYFACRNCGLIFSGELDPDMIQTHNDAPDGRTHLPLQKERLKRVVNQLRRKPERMLDFGCGHGYYLRFLKEQGIDGVGIDQNTQLQLKDILAASLDAINMVEVIEHLPEPARILGQLADRLKPGGVIYIESSFADFLGDPARSDYIDPRIGHCCIHSRKSMDYLAKKLGLQLGWLNNNVAIMRKMAERVLLTPFWRQAN